MGTIYVAKSKTLQAWGADVGLGKNTLYKIGFVAEDGPEAVLAAGLAGMTDWELIKTQETAADVSEEALLERLARKEKLVDPAYYPKVKGARGLVKVDLMKVENSMRIRIALETNQEPKTLKVKPVDIAQYLINNALG